MLDTCTRHWARCGKHSKRCLLHDRVYIVDIWGLPNGIPGRLEYTKQICARLTYICWKGIAMDVSLVFLKLTPFDHSISDFGKYMELYCGNSVWDEQNQFQSNPYQSFCLQYLHTLLVRESLLDWHLSDDIS